MESRAIISNSGLYRYELHRTWDEDKDKVLFIMLNPSTADGWENDLTTIRCMNFATKWGYGGIMIGNIYPFRAKRPKDLKKWINDDSVDIKSYSSNVDHIYEMAYKADLIVCAWGGNFPYMPNWVSDIDSKMGLHYLELCDDGITPKHPLGNLSKDLVPKQYKLNTIID